MAKYNCLNPIAACGLDLFPAGYEQTDDFAQADVALVRSAAMHDMELSDNLIGIARAGAGVNNIPLDKCADKGIVVFNTPGANANGVKELVIASLILASRDVVGGINWVNANKDDENLAKTVEKAKKAYAGTEIAGKKLGVIGLGAIGVLVANAATHLGMEVYGCDPFISVDSAWNLSRSVKHVKTREEIFKECDYITVHTPLVDDTRDMINKDTIAMMKDGVIILNFARGELVNSDDIIEAVGSGKVKKYMTDLPNTKIAGVDGIVCVPHLGASTQESEDNCAVIAVKEIIDFVDNGNIKNSVNYPACNAGICESAGRIAICHKNIPNMISQCTQLFADNDINIDTMTSKSKGDYAYTLLDLSKPAPADAVSKLSAIDGILKVRVVK